MIEKLVIDIHAPPEKVFKLLCEYDKHYNDVSDDHIERVVNIRDPDLEHPDVRFYFRQISPITGREQKVRGKVTRVELNRYIGTRFLFPVSLFLRKAVNTLEFKGDITIYTTYLHFTFIARLTKKSTRKVITHIYKEMENTKKMLEGYLPL